MSRFKIGNIKGPKGDKGEQGATGPKGEQGIQGPEGPAGGVNSVNGMTGDVTVEDTQGINLFSESIKWESGSFLPESGNLNNNNIRIRMIDYSPISKNVCYTISIFSETDSYEFVLYAYDEQYNFLPRESSLNWLKTLTTTFTNCAYYKIAVRHSDDTVIDVSEINTLVRMKLERGTVPNPVWTPAPEDVVVSKQGIVDKLGYTPLAPADVLFKNLGTQAITEINEWADNMPINTTISMHNARELSDVGFYVGNQQDIIAWSNDTHTYVWLLIMSFNGIFYGTRMNAQKFTFTKLNA